MNTERKRLLPESVYHPLILLLMCTLPQVVLLALQGHAFDLVRGELNPAERGAHLTVFALLGGCITLSGGLGAWIWKTGRRVSLPVALLIFGAGFGYLWAFLTMLDDLIPRSVGNWMLSEDELSYNHMSLIAPSLFYGLILLAGAPYRALGRRDAVYSGLVVMGIPLFWAVLAQAAFAIDWDVDLPQWIFLFILFAMTALMFLAFFRMLLHLHRWIGTKALLPLLAGLVLPLAGLALNISIPFPTDLQDVRVYALTILNGIVLCLPAAGAWLAPCWLLRAALFPFTVYFFILFLPFLPLSIPAMIAVGSGFLILAPALLFVVQTRRIAVETAAVAGRIGRFRTAALLLLALSLLPAGYIGRAWCHRHALNQAIEAVYEPDYANADAGIDTGRALAALSRLQEMKEGIYAPLLSEVYDSIVFGGMVLPDHKIEEMQRILGYTPPEEPPRNRTFEFFGFFRNSRNRRADWSRAPAIPREVALADVQVQSVTNGTLVESEMVVTMTNHGAGNAEFLGAVSVPDGVAISGYWLDVEGERVEGRIFDRKTALWVFHMIRDRTRRDPGMIHYVNDHTVELRVFPFSAGQTRTCAIQFLYPRGMGPSITISDRNVVLSEGDGPGLVEAGPGLLAPPGHGLPIVVREPYVHVLVDASTDAADDLPEVEAKIEALLERSPDATHLRIDLVNHGSRPVSEVMLDRATWRDAWRAALVKTKPSGGFWPQRAINHVIYQHARSDERLTHAPAIVVMSGNTATWEPGDFLPEHTPDITIDTFDAIQPSHPSPVIALRRGERMAWLDHARGGFVSLPGDGPLEVYDPAAASWTVVEPSVRLLPESRYARWAELRAEEDAMASNPATAESRRTRVLELSREHGLLSRHTAFIVVENSAQWKMLERKEKDAMKAKDALTFDEFQETHVTPEPSTWLMIALLVPFAAWRWRRARV